MNKIYHLVYNPKLGIMQVVSELASGAHSSVGSVAGKEAMNWPLQIALAAAIAMGLAATADAAEITSQIQNFENAYWSEDTTIKSGAAWVQSSGTGSINSLDARRVAIVVEDKAQLGGYYGYVQVNELWVQQGGSAWSRGDGNLGAGLRVAQLKNDGMMKVWAPSSWASKVSLFLGYGNNETHINNGNITNEGEFSLRSGTFNNTSTGSLANSQTGEMRFDADVVNTGSISNAGTMQLSNGVLLDSTNRIVNTGTLKFHQTSTRNSGLRGGIDNDGLVEISALSANGASSTFNAGVISGTGRVAFVGDAVVTIESLNSYSGGTELSGSQPTPVTVNLKHAQGLGTGGVSLNAGGQLLLNTNTTAGFGSLQFRGGTLSAATGITNAVSFTERADGSADRHLRFGSSGNNGTVVLSTSGAVGMPSDYDLTVNAGTLRYAAGMGTVASRRTATIASGATLDVSQVISVIGSLQGAGTVNVGGSELTLDGTGSNFSGLIQGSGNGQGGSLGVNGGQHVVSADISTSTVAVNGSGTSLTLSGDNTMGSINVGTGTLALGSSTAAGGRNGHLTAAGSRLAYADNIDVNTRTTLAAMGTRFNVASGSARHSGVIDERGGVFGLDKTGTGTLVLLGNNTYTGITTVSDGLLQVSGTLKSNLVNTSGGGSLALDTGALGTTARVAMSGTGSLTLSGSSTLGGIGGGSGNRLNLGAGAVTVGGSNADIRFDGVIAGTGSLTHSGLGAWTLGNAVNTFSGHLTNDKGTLNITGALSELDTLTGTDGGTINLHGESLGNATTLTLRGGSTLNLNGNEQVALLSGDADSVVKLGASQLTVGAGSAATYSGVISGTGGVSVNNTASAVFTLAGSNTYTGTTQISGGSLDIRGSLASRQINASNAGIIRVNGQSLADTAAVSLAGTSSLQLWDSETIGSLMGASSTLVGLAGNTLTTGGNGTNTVFSGQMSGTGGLNKVGSGRFSLGGYNSYTGLTTVSAGELNITGSVMGSVSVGSDGMLSGSGRIGGDVSVNGTLSAGNSPGVLSIAGDLHLNSGSVSRFELGQAGVAAGTGNDLVGVGGNLTLGGTLHGEVAGAGYYRLFDYSGTAHGSFDQVNLASTTAGFDVAAHDIRTQVPGQVNLLVLGAGQTLQFWDGSQTTTDNTVNGGSGTWGGFGSNWTTVNGDVNQSWAASVGVFAGNAGRVTVDSLVDFDTLQFSTDGYRLEQGQLSLAAGMGRAATLNVDPGLTATIASDLVNGLSNSVQKIGGGTLVLSGNNRFSGDTSVRQGTLVVQGGNALADNGVLNLAPATSLHVDDSERVGSLDARDALITGADTRLTVAGHFEQAGGSTGGTIALDVGSFTQSAGAVIAAGSSVNGSGNTQLRGGSIAGAITGAGPVQVRDGLTVVTGSIASNAITVDQGGQLQSGAGALSALAQVNVGQSGLLDLRGNQTLARLDTAGSVNLGGSNVTLTLRGDSRLDGTMVGAGALHVDGANVTASNLAHTGATRISNGSLALSGALASSDILVGAGARLLTSGSALSATAALAVDADGQVLLGGDESLGTVNAGAGTTVALGEHSLHLSGNSNISGALTGTGTLAISSGVLHLSGAALDFAGTTALDDASLSLGQAADSAFGGRLGGTGNLLKQGAGTLTLFADSSGFTGHSRVQAGTLTLAPSAVLGGLVTVDATARLTGTGRIGGLDLAGTLETGHAIGMLNVSGDALLRSGSRWNLEVDDAGNHDQLQVGGQVTIQGGSVVSLGSGDHWAPATNYLVVQAGGGVSGQFDQVSSNFSFLDPVLRYSGNSVTLSLLRNDIALNAVALTRNQRNVAGALDGFYHGNPLYDAMVLQDAEHARAGFDALSGEVHVSTRSALLVDRVFEQTIERRLSGQVQALDGERGSLWASAQTQSSDLDGDGNGASARTGHTGMTLGADWNASEHFAVGAAFGTQRSDHRQRMREGKVDIDARLFGLYGQARWGAFTASASLAHHGYQLQSTREAVIGSRLQEQLRGRGDANAKVAQFEAAWTFQAGAAQLQPYVQVSHSRLDADALQESGGDSALVVAAGDDRLTLATAAVRSYWDTRVAQLPVRFSADLSWQRASGDLAGMGQHRFALGGQAFDVAAAPLAKSVAALELGVSVRTSARSALSLGAQFQNGSGRSANGAQLDWRLGF